MIAGVVHVISPDQRERDGSEKRIALHGWGEPRLEVELIEVRFSQLSREGVAISEAMSSCQDAGGRKCFPLPRLQVASKVLACRPQSA